MKNITTQQIYESLNYERRLITENSNNILDILKLNFSFPSKLISEYQNSPDDVSFKKCIVNGLECEWVIHKNANIDRRMLYLHGGAFLFGNIDEYRHLCAILSEKCKCAVLIVNYRLAPKHPFPAAIEDVYSTYNWLLKNNIYENRVSEKTYVCGDSAGATLTLALIFLLVSDKIRMPNAIVSICVSVDESRNHKSWIDNRESDHILGGFSEHLVKDKGKNSVYLKGHSVKDKLVSPIFGDFHGFPPTLLQVSNTECLRDDSLALYMKMCKANVDVILDISNNMPHVWHLYAPMLPEANQSIDKIAAFILKH